MSLKVLEATSERLNLRINARFYILILAALVCFIAPWITLANLAYRAEIRLDETSLSYRQNAFRPVGNDPYPNSLG